MVSIIRVSCIGCLWWVWLIDGGVSLRALGGGEGWVTRFVPLSGVADGIHISGCVGVTRLVWLG